MKVFNLRCAHGHGFEGWFASEDAFVDQNARGLVACPLCSDSSITRLPSAPRLNLSGAREPSPATPQAGPAPDKPGPVVQPPPEASLEAMWLQAVQHVMRNTEDVGARFTEEARRIHYGETEQRGIRGQATAEQRAELADEGIDVMQLPLPTGLDGPAH
ncbi:DUF1178 family protein [Aquabacterium sp.]|uniref:DUF1178 family protein n=1 Tax=Aquabacterium sp. TaxID=1872578 RepID=UPI002C9A26BB|nr:DUF1178 family protein [Aquabacterium sp.]HSW03289.1 DUF1178 family protein [Aquabacterium sp.]